MSTPTLFRCEKLETGVPGKVLCSGLDLNLGPGDRVALIGANGSGKTTLLHTLAGLGPARSGTIELHGTALDRWPRREAARHLGLLFQDNDGGLPTRVLETALMGRHPHLSPWSWEGPEDTRIARDALATVGLAGMEDRDTDHLSGGERQRLAIATLITQSPQVMLLDEPANHLDPAQQVQILEALDAHLGQSGACTLMSLHDVNLALRFCNRTLLLFGDGCWLEGNSADVITEDNLARLYGHPMQRLEGPRGSAFLPG
ncbi:MAG: ABC transporter ATP-binding protein [Gammaproteobacteria bacterium]